MTQKSSKANTNITSFNSFSDSQLISWYLGFLDRADPSSDEDYEYWKAFKEEVKSRSQEVQDKVAFIDSIL